MAQLVLGLCAFLEKSLPIVDQEECATAIRGYFERLDSEFAALTPAAQEFFEEVRAQVYDVLVRRPTRFE